MAANTDKFRKMKSNYSSTLNGAIASGDTTIAVSSLSGIPTDTAVTMTIDRVDANGNSTPTKVERVIGVNNGSNQLTTCTRGVDSTTAQSHASGAVTEMIWDAQTWNDAVSGVLVEHSQSGTHNIPASSMVGQYAVDTGTANAVATTLSPAITSYVTGMKVRIKVANNNTTATTLNLNSLGTKTIKKQNGTTDLVSGDLVAGQIYIFVYDGTNFQLVSPTGNTAQNASPTFTGTETVPTIQGSASHANFPAVIGEYDNGNSGTTITIDWSKGDRQKLTMTGNCTISYSNAVAGQTLTLRIVEDATGGRTITLPTSKWPGGSAGSFTTTANAINLLIVYFDGTNYLTQIAAGFA